MSDRGGFALRLMAMALFALVVLVVATTSWTFLDRFQSARAAERAQALRLCDERKELEALPILEKLAAANPNDRVVCEGLARALVSRSDTMTSDADATKQLLRARTLLTRFRLDKSLSQSGQVLLTMIPPDGRRLKPSSREEVATAMRSGEAAFGRGNFAKSFEAYARAFQLDPKNYSAALYAGDSLFSQGRLNEACEWFARAVAIDADRSTAYRYWGDALQKLDKPLEARDRFFDGIIAEPYTRTPWLSLNQWADRNQVVLVHPRVLPLASKSGAPIEPRASDGTSHVIRYAEARIEWEKERFPKEFPGVTYRHSLREEVDALARVAQAVSADVRSGTVKRLDPSLATLIKLHNEGLLEPFVLISSADAGVAQDYEAYRKQHRDKLVRYLTDFVAPMTRPRNDPANAR